MRVTTNYRTPSRIAGGVMLLAMMFLFAPNQASALTDVYQLSQSIGKPTDMTGSTYIYGRSSFVASPERAIGFTFKFDGKNYTTFSVSTAGVMSLGTVTQRYYYPRYFPDYDRGGVYDMNQYYPLIAPMWLYVGYPQTGGKVHSKLTGTAPNRVLTIEWQNVYAFGQTSIYYPGGTFQVRLYETSNKIEFWYGTMRESGTSSYRSAVGLASSTSRFINIWGNDITENRTYPSGQYYTYRYPRNYPMVQNRVFTFNPCEKAVQMTGNIAEGGTVDMDPDEDVLLVGKQVKRGSQMTYRPFTMSVPANGCDPLTWTTSVTGTGAADYRVNPGQINLGEKGSPELVFTPQAVGERPATITYRFSNGDVYSFNVNAEGLNRIDWLADVNQGGVNGMNNGATLLSNIDVNRGDTRDLMPFTIGNNNPDAAQTLADVTYILDDPLEEYSLDVPNGTVTGNSTMQTGRISIGANGSSTPIITFSPHPNGTAYGTGPQEATLTVIADNERRVFTLAGFSVAPALDVYYNDDDVIAHDRNFYRGVVTCVGEEASVYTVRLENTNRADVVIDEFAIYEVDSRFQQGTPPYPLARDAFGNLKMAHDYVVSTNPGVAPIPANTKARFPMTIAPGETVMLYMTYVGQRPGKRYARAFMRTNAVNFFSPDMNNFIPGQKPTPDVEGLMTTYFAPRSLGSGMSGDAEGQLDGLTMNFDKVKVGESVEGDVAVFNTGECDMRISIDRAHLTTGDVDEFELLSIFGEATKDGQDYIIAPGASATIRARFTPSRSGSRRASVVLQSNDSTVGGDGITARGLYFLNLYGVGSAELEAYDVALDPAVLDGPSSQGYVEVVNTSTEVIEVTNLEIVGPDAAELVADPANPWPAMPFRMEPGDVLMVGVALVPGAGAAEGVRNAQLVVSYGSETATANITGLVGTRLLSATPMSLFEGMQLPIGEIARQSLIIVNNGTFPVSLSNVSIQGAGMGDYTMHSSGRTVIDAGGFEIIEVTYAPTAAGNSDATLVIESDATSGQIDVMLSGSAATTSPSGGSANGTRQAETGSSNRAVTPHGILDLGALAPNPARNMAGFSYSLPGAGAVSIGIYDVNGTLVRSIASGEMAEGTYEASFDVTTLSSGVYMLRLDFNGTVVTRPMTVVN